MSVFGTKGRDTQIATLTAPGLVRPDGLTMFTNPNSGALSSNVGIGKAITTYFVGGNNVTTPTFDLVNFSRVEIRYNLFVGGSGGGLVSILAFDTAGGSLSTQEPTYAVWRGTTSAITSGSAAVVIPLTELSSTAGPYFGTVTIVRPDFPYTATTSVRSHIQWDGTGCYQGVGAATTSGRGYFTYSTRPPATVRFTSSIGLSDIRGFFNIIHYS